MISATIGALHSKDAVTAVIIELTIDKATENINKTSPWFAWNLANLEFLAAKIGTKTNRPKYASIAMTLLSAMS